MVQTQRLHHDVRIAGEATGTAIDPIMIHNAEELDAAFPSLERSRPDAVIVQPSLPTKRAAELALSYRIPAVCPQREFAYDGGLIAYFASEAAGHVTGQVVAVDGAQSLYHPLAMPG